MTIIKQLIAAQHIRMTVEWAPNNPNMGADAKWSAAANHYKCVLKCGKRQMTVPFSQGCAHTSEPSAEDVLDCLASDATSVKNARGFEDWCAEYGYDTDSRSAEKTFRICERQAEQLERLLGPAIFETLLWHCERV